MSFLKFETLDPKSYTGKTKIVHVKNYSGDVFLGRIKFYPQWRKFVFLPKEETIFDVDCLRMLADKCQELTKEWKAGLQK